MEGDKKEERWMVFKC